MMTPTIHNEGPYQFFFYASDREEPRHVHVKRDQNEAKFWLEPVSLARNYGFAGHELNRIEEIVVRKQQKFVREWNEFFGIS